MIENVRERYACLVICFGCVGSDTVIGVLLFFGEVARKRRLPFWYDGCVSKNFDELFCCKSFREVPIDYLSSRQWSTIDNKE